MLFDSFKKMASKLSQSEMVLYLLVFVTIVNIVGYYNNNNLEAILLFLFVGYGITYLTKNMVYVILIALLVTNSFHGIKKHSYLLLEGFKEGVNDKVVADNVNADNVNDNNVMVDTNIDDNCLTDLPELIYADPENTNKNVYSETITNMTIPAHTHTITSAIPEDTL